MLARREAIESAGFLDERFFMYSDETDFCRRIKAAGWEIRHLPSMTIIHHEGKAGIKPSIESLNASSRMLLRPEALLSRPPSAVLRRRAARSFPAIGLRRLAASADGWWRRPTAGRSRRCSAVRRCPSARRAVLGSHRRPRQRYADRRELPAPDPTNEDRRSQRPDHRRRRPACLGSRGAAPRPLRGVRAQPWRARHHRSTRRWTQAFERVQPAVVFNCAAFHNVEVCEREEDRSFEVNAEPSSASRERCADAGAAPRAPQHQLRLPGRPRGALLRGRPAEPAQRLRDLQAGRRARGPRLLPRRPRRSRLRSLRPPRERVEGRQLRAAHVRPRARAGRAEDGRRPAPDAHLHGGPGRVLIAAVEGGVRGLLHVTNSGACSWHEFTARDHGASPAWTFRWSRSRRSGRRAAPTGR